MKSDSTTLPALISSLIQKCAESYEHGRSLPVPVRNLDEKCGVKFFVSMYLRVPESDVFTMLLASQFRAKAVALSRAGDMNLAHSALENADLICEKSDLSREATAANSSFQNAAKAYVQYRMQEYRKAEESLRAALNCCRILRDQYHYEVDVRRITLARHLVRVKGLAGRREAAFDSACLLVRYIEGATECWPFPSLGLTSGNDVLNPEDRLILLDQTVGEITSLLAKGGNITLLMRRDQELFSERTGLDSRVSRARIRLSAMRSVAENDQVGFLEQAIIFFREGPGYMPRAWKEMSREFIQLCGDVASIAVATSECSDKIDSLSPIGVEGLTY